MNKFKKRELSEAFFTSVLINIFEKFKKTKYYEEYDRKGEFTYSYEIRCKDDFIKYMYPFIAIDENNANFDNFKIEFIRDYNYIDTYKEEDFLVIIEYRKKGIEYKKIGIDKIYSGIRIKKIIKEIDLNEIFYGTEDEEKEIDSND